MSGRAAEESLPAPRETREEFFDVVDEDDRVVGRAARSEVHGNPALLHRVVHVLVFDSQGRLFLQRRADDKDVQPGKWDTSVGGHVDAGEERSAAALREMEEELGIPPDGTETPNLVFLHGYIHSNEYESESVHTWMCRWDGPFALQQSEISEGRFWTPDEIDALVGRTPKAPLFTPNFLDELDRWRRAGSPLP